MHLKFSLLWLYLLNGHYRKSFDRIRRLPKLFPNVPLMALTATATPAVKKMLRDLLGRDCAIVQSSVNRPNIYLEAHELKLPQMTQNMVSL